MTARPISVLMVSPSDRGGGAEMIARVLFTACRSRGYDMKMAVGARRDTDDDVFEFDNDRYRSRWARWWLARAEGLGRAKVHNFGQPLRWLRRRLGHEDMAYPASHRLLDLVSSPVDVVHAHNLHGLDSGFFDLRALPSIARRTTILLTLHDSWLLTGHCAHSFECARWEIGCGRCPDIAIPEAIRRDGSAFNWRRKREIFRRCPVFVVTPSRWLMDRVESSLLAPAVREGTVIPNGIDLEVFRPGCRASARNEFGLAADIPVILCLGNALRTNIWKDFSAGVQAVRTVARRLGKKMILLAVGTAAPPEKDEDIDLISIGPLTDPSQVAAAFHAADVYLHPAKVDTFPTTILEAMACGLPIVASDVGGVGEQITDGVSGFLIPAGDVRAMADRLHRCLSDAETGETLGAAAAERARKEFGVDLMVDRYAARYEQIGRNSLSAGSFGENLIPEA